jgi:ABC-type sugar transport system permease subunit
VLLAPYAITESSGIVMWRYMFEPDVGLVSYALGYLGLGQLDWSTKPVATLLLASIIAIWHHLPFTFLILYAALTTVPQDVLEASEIDGATRWQQFWLITLRLIMPAVLIAVLFRYIFAIRTFAEVWLLTEGGPARLSEVLAIYLYREMFKYHQFGMASATGCFMLAMSLLIAWPYLAQDVPRGDARCVGVQFRCKWCGGRSSRWRSRGRPFRSCSWCCPRSRQASQIFEVPPSLVFRPTLENYETLWTARPEFFRALGSSAIVTLGAVLVAVCAATLAGYVYARYRNRLLSGTAFGMLAARMLPPIIITVPLFPSSTSCG